MKVLVTGGSGFLGEVLVRKLLSMGHSVKVFDINEISFSEKNLFFNRGDIRDKSRLKEVMKDVDVVHHNVAQVPLAKDKELFWSVNRDGTDNALRLAMESGVQHFVYTSSSAVYGVPKKNPIFETDSPAPFEEYGRAKYAGEERCEYYQEKGLSVTIIRPRTILGHGRLGIFQILFEWIYQGKNIPVLGAGDNVYQFVHASDFADTCVAAGEKKAQGVYNIGSGQYSSMRDTLENLVQHAKSPSQVRSVNKNFAEKCMTFGDILGLSPLGPYHAMMYGESMYFDIEKAKIDLDYCPRYSQYEMFADSYDWYVQNRDHILGKGLRGSRHQSSVKQGLLKLLPYFI